MAIAATSHDAAPIRLDSAQRTAKAETGNDSAKAEKSSGAEQDDLSFWDVLDIINPLQHLPVVGNIYRAVTGDTIKETPRMIGGILFGGVLGGASALANIICEEKTGRDIGGNAIAAVFGDDAYPSTASHTDVAAANANSKSNEPISILPANSAPAAAAQAQAPAAQTAAAPARVPAASTAAASDKVTDAAKAAFSAEAAKRQTQPLSILRQGSSPAAAPQLASELSGAPHPTKMPTRDTIPASTVQARLAAAEVTARRNAGMSNRGWISPPRAKDAAASSSPATTAADASASPVINPNFAGAVDPSSLPDIMMRNLAKYEQTKRAAESKSAATVNVSG